MKKNTFSLLCLFMIMSILCAKAQAPGTAQMQDFDPSQVDSYHALYTDASGAGGAMGTKMSYAYKWSTETYSEATIGTKKAILINYPANANWSSAIVFNLLPSGLTTTTVNAYSRIKFDVWLTASVSDAVGSLRFRNNAPDPNNQVSDPVYIGPLTGGSWHTIDVALSDVFSPANLTQFPATLMLFQSGHYASPVTMYIDNIVLYTPKMPSAPTPTLNNPLPMWTSGNTNWSSNAVQEMPLGGNECRKITLNTTTTSGIYTIPAALTIGTQNALHLNVYAKNLPASFQVALSSNGTTYSNLVSVQSSVIAKDWVSITIPLSQLTNNGFNGTTVKSIAFRGTNGAEVWVDDIIFYEEDGNLTNVADVYQGTSFIGSFISIKEAYDHIRNVGLTGNVSIRITANSKEPNEILIDMGYGSVAFSSLVIYPTIANVTVTYTGTTAGNLFAINNPANATRPVTIDGRIGGTGAANNLTLIAPFTDVDKATVLLNASKNVTIQNCTFKGLDPNSRPRNTIKVAGAVSNLNITNNHFDNCLLLNAYLPPVPLQSDVQTAGVIYVYGNTLEGNVVINNNHFFESTQSYFRSPIIRAYIYVTGNHSDFFNYPNQVKITNNKIGGSAMNCGGTLRIGAAGDPAGVTAGNVHGINVQLAWPPNPGGSNPDPDNNSHYVLIEGNQIANFELYNKVAGVYANGGDATQNFSEFSGGFTGIYTTDGYTLVRNNTINDIKLTSLPVTNTEQRLLFAGICSSIFGGHSRALIEDNKLFNITVDYTTGNANCISFINGIFSQIDHHGSSSEKPVTTIRNNRILMGHRGTNQTNSWTDIHGITARVQFVGSNPAQMDVYNNVVVMNECKLTTGLRNISPIDLLNNADSQQGIINLYNNIIAVAPVANNSFQNVDFLVSGINYISEDGASGLTNIFHNTVFLGNSGSFGANGPTAALNMEYRKDPANSSSSTSTGHVKVWNNNLINEVETSGASVYHSTMPNNSYRPITAYFDYNNYYVPANGYMYKFDNGSGVKDSIKTLDNWKFSNRVSYLAGKTSEHDFHSRWGNTFSGAITQDTTGLANAKTQFAPERFLAGKNSEVTTLGLRKTTVNSNYYVSSVAMTNTDNLDIRGNVRRTNLPTVGAVNTTFSNYFTGTNLAVNGGFANHIPATGEDMVFVENATVNYAMTTDLNVRDIYNDTQRNLIVGAHTLNITGYVGQVGAGRILATDAAAVIVYSGDAGHTINGKRSAAAQHIFPETFSGYTVSNLRMNNLSQYFVLLHPSTSTYTLTITGDFAIANPDNTEITYPTTTWLPKGKHPGGLNCTWYNTNLHFSATAATTNHPVVTYNATTPYTYRPYAGQRIPRHAIYNDSLYILTNNSNKLITYHDSLFVKNTLTIGSGKSFEIAADKLVKVDGTTTNSGGVGGLVIKSREIGTAETGLNAYLFPKNPRPNATFIFNPANNVDATVEMFSPTTQTTNTTPSNGGIVYTQQWQYFGTPVTTFSSTSAIFAGSTIFEYLPQGTNNLAGGGTGSPYWKAPSANFTVGHGYCIYNPTNKVYSWTGRLVTANQTNSLAYTVSPITQVEIDSKWIDFVRTDGRHLLANPYAAGVDIRQMTLTNTDQTIYLYTTGSYAEYANTSVTNPLMPGKTLSIPYLQAGTTQSGVYLPSHIPSMQAFTVRVNSGQTGTVAFNYDATTNKIGKNEVTQRSAVIKPETLSMRVDLKRDGYVDWALMLTHPDCKKGFDPGWDGRTTPSKNMPLSIFTIEEEAGIELEDSYYQISTMDDFDGVYLGILVNNDMRPADSDKIGITDEYELVFNHELDGTPLLLEDLLLKKTVDISKPGSTYSFTESHSGEIQKRFRISLRSATDDPTGLTDLTPQATNIYSSGKTIVIEKTAEAGTIWVYDVTGRCVLTTNISAGSQTRLDTDLNSGVYFVKLITGGNTIDTKIIMK